MAAHRVVRSIRLRDDNEMPCLGFGCYQLKDPYTAVTAALGSGYRYIDTARVYKNEDACGRAIADAASGMTLPRASVFVTTKVNARSHSLKETPKAIRQSLTRLGLDYIDLYLLHDAISGRERRLVAWKCLVDYRDRGLVRSIGVSNWGVRHLEELVDEGLDLPVVNQIELHPWCQQREIVEYCQSNGIVIQAYCPLVRGERLGDPTLHTVSQHVGKSPAQVLLRWSMQRGFCPVVKSDTTSRIEENFEVFDFELDEGDMRALDALDLGEAGACSWNPVDCQ